MRWTEGGAEKVIKKGELFTEEFYGAPIEAEKQYSFENDWEGISVELTAVRRRPQLR